VFVVVVAVAVAVAVANVVLNAKNVMDFQWCPSNLHICPHPSIDTPHLLFKKYFFLTKYIFCAS
jgi:hypothetical protein